MSHIDINKKAKKYADQFNEKTKNSTVEEKINTLVTNDISHLHAKLDDADIDRELIHQKLDVMIGDERAKSIKEEFKKKHYFKK